MFLFRLPGKVLTPLNTLRANLDFQLLLTAQMTIQSLAYRRIVATGALALPWTERVNYLR